MAINPPVIPLDRRIRASTFHGVGCHFLITARLGWKVCEGLAATVTRIIRTSQTCSRTQVGPAWTPMPSENFW